ncbi:MAG: DUF1295 domain-containing protein [Acidobacteria bacterium]|nr:DUF1295 domain-containing protein [Acidobacteriota bacterium]
MILLPVAEWAIAALVMALLWVWQLRSRNARVADAGLTGLIAAFAIADARLGHGFGPRRAAIAFMMGSWGLRLMVNLLYVRVLGRQEDGRYFALRARWGGLANAPFFWLFQALAVAAVLGSSPALIASMNAAPDFSMLELVASALWIVAFAGETTADRQFLRFLSVPEHTGQTCRAGLWRYSRHPDYWFGGLAWIAYALFAVASTQLTMSVFDPWLRR